jgi:hypothetical protein
LQRNIRTARKIAKGTENAKLPKAKPMIKNPSPGDPCPPFLTKFGSAGSAMAETTKAIKTPSNGMSNKTAAAFIILMLGPIRWLMPDC